MDTDLRALMLSCVETLTRQAIVDEASASMLAEMAQEAETSPDSEAFAQALVVMARQHRVCAIKARAQATAISAEYEALMSELRARPEA